MNGSLTDAELRAKALSRWENEGGAPTESNRAVDNRPSRPKTSAKDARPRVAAKPGHSAREANTTGLRIKRAYEARSADDGRRVLVDRLWPRGLSKHDLEGALWLKDVAPSAALRKWFGHKPERWDEFRSRYFAELHGNPAVDALREVMAAGPVTLLYSARDQAHNQAVALAEYLR